MGLLSYDPFGRQALLICDQCEHYFCDPGRSEKSTRDSDPDELAPHFRERADLPPAAVKAGWNASIGRGEVRARWTCPSCASALGKEHQRAGRTT